MKEQYKLITEENLSTGEYLKVLSPFDCKEIGEVEIANREVAESALSSAYQAFIDKKNWLKPYERIAIIEKAIQMMTEDVEYLAVEAAREGGKPYADSKVEILRAIDSSKSCIDEIRTQAGEEIPMNITPSSAGHMAFTQKYPIGVVLALSAFNHPINLIAHQVMPAVVVGCPVIVKPASDTPLSCFRFCKYLHRAGLPKKWLQVLAVSDNEIIGEVLRDERLSFLSFIGSAKVGWMLKSNLTPGARCALEHGGVAPAIVCQDANLENAISKLVKGGFYHAGQVCVSVQKIYVHDSIVEKFIDSFVQKVSALRVGDPTDKTTEVGPLIRPIEVDRVAEWVDEAITSGAELKIGGKRLSNTIYAPTVLVDPPENSKVSQNEIFGPVVCIYTYNDLEETIVNINKSKFAFQAAVFTQNLDNMFAVYKNLDANAIMCNNHTAFRVDWMPFAGLKQSGIGVGGIKYTMEEMQHDKMLVVNNKHL